MANMLVITFSKIISMTWTFSPLPESVV